MNSPLQPTPADEHLHPLPEGAGRAWRESYYFGFYDERAGVGGFESFGYRAARGHSGSMMVIWRPGDVAAALELGGALEDPTRYQVGGVVASCVEPFERWDLQYTGLMPREPEAAFRCSVDDVKASSTMQEVMVELHATFTAEGWTGRYAQQESYRHIFSGCYEQVGRLRGTLRYGEEQFELDCPSVRHHAWGERDWFKDDEWNWCTSVLDDGTACGFWYRQEKRGEGQGEVAGWLRMDDEIGQVVAVEREIVRDPAEPKPVPRKAQYRVHDDHGRELELVATVRQIVPAFFEPRDDRPLLHWNDRSLVTFDGSRGPGHGEVEFIEVLEV